MKRHYTKPVVEKIGFDYKMQIVTESPPPPDCFGSIINIATATDTCGEGQRTYIGWNSKHPGDF